MNWTKLKYLEKTIESQDVLKRITENEKTFTSFPIEEQVMFLTNVLSLRNLELLKLEILDTIEPDKKFEHNVQYDFTHQFFNLFETWFLKNCHKIPNENKLIALKTVANNIKHFEEILFDRKPWKSKNTNATLKQEFVPPTAPNQEEQKNTEQPTTDVLQKHP